ncbi:MULTISPECIES: MFS transporter [unclassified Corynebacterium]|uniref:MFS transporter n=1 Tax=unclassified Corynebacterium TaxID=2624378 RepID=UPI00309B40FB
MTAETASAGHGSSRQPDHAARHSLGVALMFATNGAMMASLVPWYPTFIKEWGLPEAAFGLVVACMPFGSLLSSVLPAWVMRKFGPNGAVLGGTISMALVVAAAGWLTNAWMLAALLLLFGAADAVADVGQNLIGVRVEHRRGKSIMSSLHACWSLGAAGGGALATTAAVAGINYTVFMVTAAVVIALLSVVAVRMVGSAARHPDDATDSHTHEHHSSTEKLWTLPVFKAVLPLVLIAIAAVVIEDIASNWAGLSAVELQGIDVASAGSAFVFIVGAQMLGRFTGDMLIDAFGRVAIARMGGIFIACGGVLVLLAPNVVVMYAGFMLAGFGCATLVPSAYWMATRLPGVSDGGGLTMVSWLMRIGFMGTSPLIGSIASVTNLSTALLILPVSGVIVVLLATAVAPKTAAQE